MGGTSRSSAHRASPRHVFGAFLTFLVLSLFIAGCVHTPKLAKAPDARRILDDRQLDSVTAGAVSVDLELSASAAGPTAVTSARGSIMTARTTVLRISVDPSAPAPAAAQLLGASAADLAFGAGEAKATGATNAQCSAIPTATGDFTLLSQSRIATGVTATCSCSAFAIGIVAP